MNPYFLISLSVVSSTARSLFSKGLGTANSGKYGLARSNVLIFSAALAVIVIHGAVTGVGTPSFFTCAAGVLFAFFVATAQILYMRALELGAASVTAFIYSSGFLLPTAAGVVHWHEALTVTKTVGTLLLLLALFLMAWNPEEMSAKKNADAKRGTSRVWRLCAFGAMFCSGMLGLLQKVHQTSPHKPELSAFLLVAMVCAATFSAVLMCAAKKNSKTAYDAKTSAVALTCGAFYGAVNIINLALAGMIPATIQFPLINGGGIILTALMGKIIFREKVSIRKWIGIAIGIVAIVVISR